MIHPCKTTKRRRQKKREREGERKGDVCKLRDIVFLTNNQASFSFLTCFYSKKAVEREEERETEKERHPFLHPPLTALHSVVFFLVIPTNERRLPGENDRTLKNAMQSGSNEVASIAFSLIQEKEAIREYLTSILSVFY